MLTLGGLVKDLAAVEDFIFTTKLSGGPIGAPWDGTGWDGSNEWEFASPRATPPTSCTPYGTARSTGPGPGWAPRWPTAARRP